VVAEAPKLMDGLADEDREHFEAVRALLDAAGASYEVDPQLVRGIDYYTRTVFEFESNRLGAQAALGGGGRYDGLVEELGGPPTPGVGFALGVERVLMAAEEEEPEPSARAYLAWGAGKSQLAFEVARRLRAQGLRAEVEQAGRSMKGQLRQADRIGAKAVVIVDESIEVKDMTSGRQQPVRDADEAIERVRELLAPGSAA
jgi:histidyl-tRNA synthetase